MANNSKPNYRIRKISNAKNLATPEIKAVVELKKPNLEMHLETEPGLTCASHCICYSYGNCTCNSVCSWHELVPNVDVCTGNPMCYCVGVAGCSCDQVCSCDAVCAKDPSCSCVGYSCTCEGYCSCEGHCGSYCACDSVCSPHCSCNWDGFCDCNAVCTWYPT
jgi:hypothetical protein